MLLGRIDHLRFEAGRTAFQNVCPCFHRPAFKDERLRGCTQDYCGRHVDVRNPATGKSVQVTIVDVCELCTDFNSLDLSKAAFQELAPLSVGKFEIESNVCFFFLPFFFLSYKTLMDRPASGSIEW